MRALRLLEALEQVCKYYSPNEAMGHKRKKKIAFKMASMQNEFDVEPRQE